MSAEPSTAIDRRDVRRQQRAQLAGAAAQVADPQRVVEQRQRGLGVERPGRRDRRAAGPTGPTPSRRTPRRSSAAVRARPSAGARPARRRAARLTCSRISGHSRAADGSSGWRQAVEARGAVAPRRHPAAVGQRLEVAAHGRLRQLQHRTQLGHGQLVALEQQQHPAAQRVGQRRHVLEHLGQRRRRGRARTCASFIRKSGYEDIHDACPASTPSRNEPFREGLPSIRLARIFSDASMTDHPRPERFLPLAPVWFEILLALAAGDLHGYAVMQEVARRSGGAVTLHPGSLYRALARLLEDALIVELDGATGVRRRRAAPLLPDHAARTRGGPGRSRAAARRWCAPPTTRALFAPAPAPKRRPGMTPMPPWLLRAVARSRIRGRSGSTSATTCATACKPRGRRRRAARRSGIASSLLARTVTHGLAERGVRRRAAWPPGAAIGRISTSPSGTRAGMWDGLLHDLRAAARALAAARGLHGAGGGGAGPRHRRQRRDLHRRQRRAAEAAALPRRRSAGDGLEREPADRRRRRRPLSPADFADLRTMSRSFSAMDYALSFVVRTRRRRPRGRRACCTSSRVGDGMLDAARRARRSSAAVFGDGERDVAVLSDAAWRGRFGADPAIVGRRISLVRQRDPRDRRRRRARVRVPVSQHARARPGFATPHGRPTCGCRCRSKAPRWRRRRRASWCAGRTRLVAVGRLAPGVTLAQADAEVAAHAATLAERHPRHQPRLGRPRRRPSRADRGRGAAGAADPAGRRRRAAADGGGQRRQPDAGPQPRAAARAGGARGARRQPLQLVRQVLAEARAAGRGRRRRVAAGRALGRRRPGRVWPRRALPRIADVAPDGTVVAAARRRSPSSPAASSASRRCGPPPAPTCARCCRMPAAAPPGASSAGRRLRAALVVGQVALAAVLAVQAGLLTRSLAAVLDARSRASSPTTCSRCRWACPTA